MVLLIVRLPWLGLACVLSWLGSTPTDVAIEGERASETGRALDVPIRLRMPSCQAKPCLHDQKTDVQDLL